MKIFKRVLLITFIVYNCLILSLYIFPSSKMRVIDVVDTNGLFAGPQTHIMLSTPIYEKPIKKPPYYPDGQDCITCSYVTVGKEEAIYNYDNIEIGDYLYKFKYDEGGRHDILYYNTGNMMKKPWGYPFYGGFQKIVGFFQEVLLNKKSFMMNGF